MKTLDVDYRYLDGARGLSALVVLLAHGLQIFWLPSVGIGTVLHQVSTIASHYAVVVFFLLSGFLVAHSIETNIKRNGVFKVVSYGCARFARIYPPFLVAMAVTILIYCVMDIFHLPGRESRLAFPGDLYSARDVVFLSVQEVLKSLLMLNGSLDVNGPLWSLYIEVKLYVLAACFFCFDRAASALVAVVVGSAIVVAGLHCNPEFCRYAALWIVGCTAFYSFGFDVSKRLLKLLLAFACLLIFSIAGYYLPPMLGHIPRELSAEATVTELLIAILTALGLFNLSYTVPGQRVAPYSYTLYVIHFPILLLLRSLMINGGHSGLIPLVVISFLSLVIVLFIASLLGKVEKCKRPVQGYLNIFLDRNLSSFRSLIISMRT